MADSRIHGDVPRSLTCFTPFRKKNHATRLPLRFIKIVGIGASPSFIGGTMVGNEENSTLEVYNRYILYSKLIGERDQNCFQIRKGDVS